MIETRRESFEGNIGVRNERAEWIRWLEAYGAGPLYDAFMRSAQGAQSECTQCGQAIYLDISEGGGVPDWGSSPTYVNGRMIGLDYGCFEFPRHGRRWRGRT